MYFYSWFVIFILFECFKYGFNKTADLLFWKFELIDMAPILCPEQTIPAQAVS